MEYVKTIGRLEPSYVIRKYLDAQRIPQLCTYLEALHKRAVHAIDTRDTHVTPLGAGEAHLQPEHTTLLLNCYAKMRNTDALDRFIRVLHIFIFFFSFFPLPHFSQSSLIFTQDAQWLLPILAGVFLWGGGARHPYGHL